MAQEIEKPLPRQITRLQKEAELKVFEDKLKNITDKKEETTVLKEYYALRVLEPIIPENPTYDDLYCEMNNAFKIFDKHSSGFITDDKLKHYFTNFGNKIEEEYYNEMVKEVGTEKICYNKTKGVCNDECKHEKMSDCIKIDTFIKTALSYKMGTNPNECIYERIVKKELDFAS